MKLLNVCVGASNYGINEYGVKNGLPTNTLKALNIHSGLKGLTRGVLINITDSIFQKIGFVMLYNFFKSFTFSNSFVKLLPENNEEQTGYIIDFQPLCKHDSSVIVELESLSDSALVTKQINYKSQMYDWKYSCSLAVIHCNEQEQQKFNVTVVAIDNSKSIVDITQGILSVSAKDKLTGNIVTQLEFGDYSIIHQTTIPMFNYLMKVCDNSISEIIHILKDDELKSMHYQNFNASQYLNNFKSKLNYTKQKLI